MTLPASAHAAGTARPAAPAATGALVKLDGARLAELRPHLDLPPPAEVLVDTCVDAPAALQALVGGGFLLEAARLLAHALPRREAVWWACMCARHTAPADLPAADRAALEATELWVRRPTDENRRAAYGLAEAAGFGSPEAWVGVAAFWSGDSMSPLGQPAVPPAAHLAGRAVAGATGLASVRAHPDRQARRLATFIAGAREIAGGGTGRLAAEDA